MISGRKHRNTLTTHRGGGITKMKITKRQLRRIIKEEKEKILLEMNPERDADRSLSLYANVTTTDKITDSILDILQEVEIGAAEDGLEDEESEAAARNAALLAVANAFEAAGLFDIKIVLHKMLR